MTGIPRVLERRCVLGEALQLLTAGCCVSGQKFIDLRHRDVYYICILKV